MANNYTVLSSNAFIILELISEGYSHEQILSDHPNLTDSDISKAAEEAINICKFLKQKPTSTTRASEERYYRDHEIWTAEEENDLKGYMTQGYSPAKIAGKLKRNRQAIRLRILQLGLPDLLEPKERERFDRCMKNVGLNK